jgi:bacterioferritin
MAIPQHRSEGARRTVFCAGADESKMTIRAIEPGNHTPLKGPTMDKEKVIATLNRILELETAGVVRYMHYSLMVFGHARIPIIGWMKEQAAESMAHASQAGELVTALGGHPSLKIGKLLETEKHNIDDILRETLEHEQEGVALYEDLLKLVEGKDVRLEEYAREMIYSEMNHISEVDKMLRRPGELNPVVEE